MNNNTDDKPTKPQTFKPDHSAFPQTSDYQIDPTQLPSAEQAPPPTTAPPLEVTPNSMPDTPAPETNTKERNTTPPTENNAPEEKNKENDPLTPDMLRHIREEDGKKAVTKQDEDPHKKRFYTSLAIGVIALFIFGGIIFATISFFGDNQSDPETAEPQQSRSICGNKKVETGEACDDGNLKNGDGCTSGCQFER